jgi:hypothetical protein
VAKLVSLKSKPSHLHPNGDVGDAQLAWSYGTELHRDLGSDRAENGPVVRGCKVAMEQPDAVLPGALPAARRDRALPVRQGPIEDRDQAGALRVQHLRKDREPWVSVETLGDLSYFLHKVLAGVNEIYASRNRLEPGF